MTDSADNDTSVSATPIQIRTEVPDIETISQLGCGKNKRWSEETFCTVRNMCNECQAKLKTFAPHQLVEIIQRLEKMFRNHQP